MNLPALTKSRSLHVMARASKFERKENRFVNDFDDDDDNDTINN